jgi:hypothetical protein
VGFLAALNQEEETRTCLTGLGRETCSHSTGIALGFLDCMPLLWSCGCSEELIGMSGDLGEDSEQVLIRYTD